MIESIVAFLIILILSSLIYMSSRWVTQKTHASEEKRSMYACGENVIPKKLSVNVTLYKYLVYFVIIDSPVLVIAFAALALETINPPLHLLVYLFSILIADLLLLGDY